MRKPFLLIVSGLVLLGTLGSTQSADAREVNPVCVDNNLRPGVYDNDLNRKRFDLAFNPTTQYEEAESNATAIICGTDPDFEKYVESLIVTTPGKMEELRCANPTNVSDYCERQDGDLADGAYAGSVIIDVWCGGRICSGGILLRDIQLETFIDYNTSGNGAPNRCTDDAISCAETRLEVFGGLLECNADTIITQNGRKFKRTVYGLDCNAAGDQIFPSYIVNIWNLQMCKYVGSLDGESCGNGSVPSDWQQKNSKCKLRDNGKCKKVKYVGKVTLTNGITLKLAKAKVKVTP